MRCALVPFIIAFLTISSVQGADALYGTLNGWGQMIDPDGDCRFEVGGNGVTICFGSGRHGLDSEGGSQRMNSPRVLTSVAGDFSVSTIVRGNLPLPKLSYAYISGGLVLVLDEKNYIRLERANFIRSGKESFYTNFEQRIDSKRTRMGRFADFPLERERDVELRLEVKSGNVRALVRHVGEPWHEIGTTKIARSHMMHVGISGVKTIEDEVDVAFSNFRVSQETGVEASSSSEINLLKGTKSVVLPRMPNSAVMNTVARINDLQARSRKAKGMSDAEIETLINDAKAIANENVEGINQRFGPAIAEGLAANFRRADKPNAALRVYREFAKLLEEQDSDGNQTAVEKLRRLRDDLELKLKSSVERSENSTAEAIDSAEEHSSSDGIGRSDYE